MEEKRFNIRVYGLLIWQDNVLVSDELILGKPYTKFPGGGLEWGEGIADGLKREFQEELNVELTTHEHFYTTEFFQQSAFRKRDQIVSIYYKVKLAKPEEVVVVENAFDFGKQKQVFRWIGLGDLEEQEFAFPIDREVVTLLKG